MARRAWQAWNCWGRAPALFKSCPRSQAAPVSARTFRPPAPECPGHTRRDDGCGDWRYPRGGGRRGALPRPLFRRGVLLAPGRLGDREAPHGQDMVIFSVGLRECSGPSRCSCLGIPTNKNCSGELTAGTPCRILRRLTRCEIKRARAHGRRPNAGLDSCLGESCVNRGPKPRGREDGPPSSCFQRRSLR